MSQRSHKLSRSCCRAGESVVAARLQGSPRCSRRCAICPPPCPTPNLMCVLCSRAPLAMVRAHSNCRRQRAQQTTFPSSRPRRRDLGPLWRAFGGRSSRQLLHPVVLLRSCVEPVDVSPAAALIMCRQLQVVLGRCPAVGGAPLWRPVPAGSERIRAVCALC